MGLMDQFQVRNPYQTDIVKGILARGDVEGRRAASSLERNLSKRGFGGSTFIDQLKPQAQAAAQQPYLQQASTLAEQMKQQDINNFFRAYQLDEQRRKEKQQQERNSLFSLLLHGLPFLGSTFGGPVGGFIGGALEGLLQQGTTQQALDSGHVPGGYTLPDGSVV